MKYLFSDPARIYLKKIGFQPILLSSKQCKAQVQLCKKFPQVGTDGEINFHMWHMEYRWLCLVVVVGDGHDEILKKSPKSLREAFQSKNWGNFGLGPNTGEGGLSKNQKSPKFQLGKVQN